MARLGTARCALAAGAGALLVLLCSGCGSGITSTSRVAGLPPASVFAGPAPGGPMQSVTCVNDIELYDTVLPDGN